MKGLPGVPALLAALALLCVGSLQKVHAQDSGPDSEKQLARYREMLSDPFSNPASLNADRGEQLWKERRGKNNVSLEACDLGEGPGKLEGAYAKLPRYFEDAGTVMDLEQRLLWCMDKIQNLDTADTIARRFSSPGKPSDMEDLVTFIASKSNGMKIEAQTRHPKEQEFLQAGEALFNRRSSVMDFSCATCHGQEGKRIRLQALPRLSSPGKDAQETMGSWPAYRVSQSSVRTLQHRLWDCYRQMRMPPPRYASDGLTALTLYLMKMADGGEIRVPSVKR